MEERKTGKRIVSFFLFLLLLSVVVFHKQIVQYLVVNIIYQKQMVIEEANEYEKEFDYVYVQRTDTFVPKQKQDLWNIVYSVLNKGWDHFTFYCSEEYENCLSDIDELTSNNEIISHINNFVHPFNSFDKLYIATNNFGKVEIQVDKTYQEDAIQEINAQVDKIIAEETNESMSVREKIKAIHDYIINHTKYDVEHESIINQNLNQKTIYHSSTAYGTLIEGKAICSGYTDAMAIFLNRLGLDNYKISSENHVWNYVKIDGNWYHLDLTWDDPVLDTNEDMLLHNFFLITTKELKEKETLQHQYEEKIYVEAKSK